MKSKTMLLFILPIMAQCVLFHAVSDEYTIKLIAHEELSKFRSFVAEQRITSFREYPYLYEGVLEEEYAYFDWFAKLPDTVLVVAFLNQKPVAFISGTSFVDFDQHFKGSITLFQDAGLNPAAFYYIGEVIVMPEHRNHRLCKRFFKELETWAYAHGYTKACFACEEHEKHHLKPKDYKELSPLWEKCGYTKTVLCMHFNWLTIQVDGSLVNEKHAMHYWMKDLKKLLNRLSYI